MWPRSRRPTALEIAPLAQPADRAGSGNRHARILRQVGASARASSSRRGPGTTTSPAVEPASPARPRDRRHRMHRLRRVLREPATWWPGAAIISARPHSIAPGLWSTTCATAQRRSGLPPSPATPAAMPATPTGRAPSAARSISRRPRHRRDSSARRRSGAARRTVSSPRADPALARAAHQRGGAGGVRRGASGDHDLRRTRRLVRGGDPGPNPRQLCLGPFYGVFVLAVSIHVPIGLRTIAGGMAGLARCALPTLACACSFGIACSSWRARHRGGDAMTRRRSGATAARRHTGRFWCIASPGLVLALFLPLHFLCWRRRCTAKRRSTLSCAGAGRRWSRPPRSRWCFCSLRMTGGLRLLLIEFGGWRRETQHGARSRLAGGAAAFCALAFALNLF